VGGDEGDSVVMDEGDCDVDEVGGIVGSGMVGKRVGVGIVGSKVLGFNVGTLTSSKLHPLFCW